MLTISSVSKWENLLHCKALQQTKINLFHQEQYFLAYSIYGLKNAIKKFEKQLRQQVWSLQSHWKKRRKKQKFLQSKVMNTEQMNLLAINEKGISLDEAVTLKKALLTSTPCTIITFETTARKSSNGYLWSTDRVENYNVPILKVTGNDVLNCPVHANVLAIAHAIMARRRKTFVQKEEKQPPLVEKRI